MAEPFDSSADIGSRFLRAMLESTVVPGQPVVAVSGPGGGSLPVTIGGAVASLVPSQSQVNIAVTGTAITLSGVALQLDEVVITAKLTNAANIFLGSSTVTSLNGLIMEPGRSVTLENVDLATLFINGTAPDGISRLGLT